MTEIEKFRDLSQNERVDKIKNKFEFSKQEISNLKTGGLSLETADKLIENSIGLYSLPLGIATNFNINGINRLIPMVTEEPSIIAAASKAAKIFKEFGGVTTSSDEPIATGQIQLILNEGQNPSKVIETINNHRTEILERGDDKIQGLIHRGGGTLDLETKTIETKDGRKQVILSINIHTLDAMGANITNTVCENIAPFIAELTGVRIGLKILTNLSDKRIATAGVSLGLPLEIAEKIVEAQKFAENDIYRAATHNKGIFNGIDSVALATGNDWRAIEAGGHAYAAISGKYSPLTTWEINKGKLDGTLKLPMQVGIVGGLTDIHLVVNISRKILGVTSSKELAEIMTAVGLAQNFAALYALVTTGIQEGHMKLHRRRSNPS